MKKYARRPLNDDEISDIDCQRILDKIIRRGRCWIWTGALSHVTPMCSIQSRGIMDVRRVIYALNHEHVAASDRVQLTCNTERCVSPHHLVVRTVSDMVRRARRTDEKAVKRMRKQYARNHSIEEIAEENDLSYNIVRAYVRNLRAPDPDYTPRERDNFRRVLTTAQVKMCRRRRRAGETIANLADDMSVAYSTMWEALHGTTYRNVTQPEVVKAQR